MRDLNHQLKALCRRNRDGGHATQVNRERMLTLIADQLRALGYRQLSARSLKPKHVLALVTLWQGEGRSVGTIKNRMAAIRWWAEKVGRASVVARDNAHYGIADRSYVATASRAQQLSPEALARIADVHVRMSLALQQAFGLRREEAIKFQPEYADRGDRIVLKASWTKGGKTRQIPVRTQAQRAVLNQARRLAGLGSLIPAARSYRQQLRTYERHTRQAGLSALHGLRHAYAQARYRELTGWDCPAAGGPSAGGLSSAAREVDREARAQISRELGHERSQVTTVYLGR